ncbi:MAG: hypothetical protein GF401_20240 [Chitinivibrionales bacterium]|nr:hypothetical protein [Chitinivibrionales bacterium]
MVNDSISAIYRDSIFAFSERFPLNADLTGFNMAIDYRVIDQLTGESSDTTVTVQFFVKREADAPLPDDISIDCRGKATLDLLYQDQSLVGKEIQENMTELEIRLYPGTDVPRSISTEVLSSFDNETFSLKHEGDYWSKTFTRKVENSGNPGDYIVQHKGVDSIIVIYRNPKLPLDTLRVAVPFGISREIILSDAFYFDTDADGYTSHTFFRTGRTYYIQ